MFYIELSLRVKVIFTIKYSIICYFEHLLNTTIPGHFSGGCWERSYATTYTTSNVSLHNLQCEHEPSSKFSTYFEYKTILHKHYIH